MPSYEILLAILLVSVAIAVVVIRPIMETIALRRVREVDEREYDMLAVASYLNAMDEPIDALPARTWIDLDMDDVFQSIDRTTSWPGQHLLYARLRREDHSSEELKRFEDGVRALVADDAIRLKIRATLRALDDRRASALPALFQGSPPSAPRFAWMVPVISALGVLGVIGAFLWPPLVLAVLVVVVVNAFVRAGLRQRIDRLVPAIRMLPATLQASRTLGALDVPGLEWCTELLQDVTPRLQWLARTARWLSFDATGGNEAAGYLYEYLNLLFLLDVTSYVWSIGAIRTERAAMRRAYVVLGELDAMQSIATLRQERRCTAQPVFSDGADRSVSFSALTHPLLEEPVPNSLETGGQSVLLTGSNMSGKSTFIRTVGVNAVLAQTIHTVFAVTWHAPRFSVRSSIGRADSLVEGKSYYRAEVDAIGSLLAAPPMSRRLVLIDELFRGTNSIERIAAAGAVLRQLDADSALVIAATHDAELIELLPTFLSYHFREEVRGDELTFDYRLHSGACSSRNALAILALAGFPAAVVEDAGQIARLLEKRVAGSSLDVP